MEPEQRSFLGLWLTESPIAYETNLHFSRGVVIGALLAHKYSLLFVPMAWCVPICDIIIYLFDHQIIKPIWFQWEVPTNIMSDSISYVSMLKAKRKK